MAQFIRILILEDNPVDAELIQFELQEAGLIFTARVVATEKEYIQAIQDYCPDLILSDYDLPTYNGALALAKAKMICPVTPFILVTGAVSEDRAIEILTQGAKDYVLKNRLEQRLVPAVHRALGEAAEHQARKQAEAELREAYRTLEERVKIRTAELEAAMAEQTKLGGALQDSEKRYRRLFEAAKDGILILDAATGKIDDVNPFLIKLLGYSYDELCGKYIWELGVFKDIAASREAFKVLQDNEHIRYDDLPLETVHGRVIPVEFVSNVYLVDHHKVIQCNIRDITEQTRMKQEKNKILNDLQEKEERLQALVNGINDEIWFADTRKQFTLANPSALREFGLNSNADAIDIQKFAESLKVYRPDGSARPVEEAPPLRALAGEVVKNQEEMIRTPATGEIRHRQVSSNPIRDACGQIIGSVSVVRDITEHKIMEDALRVSEERFSKAFKNSPNAITITRINDGKIIEGNDSVYDLLGYNQDEVVGKTTFDLGIWANADERVKLTHALATKGLVQNQEFTLLKKDRTPVIVDLSAALINIDNQQCFLTSFIDITKRKKMEEDLKESERKYQELIKYAPVGIYEIDFQNRKFVTVNESMILLSGYTREELLAMDPLDILEVESKKAFAARIGKMLKGEKPDENVEYKVIAKDGHIIHAILHVSFKINELGMPIGATVIGLDITERKQADELLQKTIQRLQVLVSGMRNSILVVEEDCVEIANQAFCDYFDLRESPQDLIGLSAHAMIEKIKNAYLHPEEEVTRIQEIVKLGQPVIGEEIAMQGGKTCLRDFIPMMILNGKAYDRLWIHTDITERKHAEDVLRNEVTSSKHFF